MNLLGVGAAVRGGLLLLAIGLAGCTRTYYRQSADRETYPIIAERVLSPRFAIGRTQVEPAPGSRLIEPFNPDHPPKPPDDPAAAVFMAYPGHMRGARGWGKDGYAPSIEPPNWEKALPLDAKGVLKLDQNTAVALALLDSREYQTALEDVYLQALALTLNRFDFAIRWFGRTAPTYTHFGSGSTPTETNTLTVPSALGFNRNLAAGGQLMVDLANNLVYEYTGGTSQVRSNIAVSFTQPLLRGFGRKVRLESLTQAERDTLYSVRTFARFRKQFWANIAVESGGYLNLLLLVQTLRNNQSILRRQEETYELYRELFRGGRRSVVELDQFFQTLQGSRLSVIQANISLQNALDQFKLQLGVPPRIPAELDDTLLKQFILTDPAVEELREEIDAFQRARLKELGAPPSAESLRVSFATLEALADRMPKALASATADLDRWGERLKRPARRDADPEQRERAQTAYDNLRKLLPETTTELNRVRAVIAQHRANVAAANRKASWEGIVEDSQAILALLDDVIGIQTQSRIYLIELPEVNVPQNEALAYAKEYRLDLQNQLGAVTDSWRKVTIAANALRGDLNIVTNANIATDPDHPNPVNFASQASQYSVGLQFDGPLNRRAERNAYRASLITYQRAKRAYMALSDTIEFQIRRDLRQLNQIRLNFEINRQAFLAAARQLENAKLQLIRPGPQGANSSTTLTLQQAFGSVLSTQNQLAQSYINYEQQRIQLLLDLEVLQLDQRGFPINGSPSSSTTADKPAERGELLPAPRPVAGPAAAGPPAGP